MKVNLQAPQKKKDRHERDNDNLLNNLKSKTPQEAAQWVENNVTDLVSAKKVLKAMAKVITYILRNND